MNDRSSTPGSSPGSTFLHSGANSSLANAFFSRRMNGCAKWEHYLPIYSRELGRFITSDGPVNLLEVGVQNGGSLELWAALLPAGSAVVGIDNDPAVRELAFDHPGIRVVEVDATDGKALYEELCDTSFDIIIIAGGTQLNRDVIETFHMLWKRVRRGGVYIVEDAHNSYRAAFGGGMRSPGTIMEFFKSLADAINADHFEGVSPSALEREIAETAVSVAFYDSLVIIERGHGRKSAPYRLAVSGSDLPIADHVGALAGQPRAALDPPVLGRDVGGALSAELIARAEAAERRAAAAEAALKPAAAEADVRVRRLLAEAEARASSLEARLHVSEARADEAARALRRIKAGEERSRADLARQAERASAAEEAAELRTAEIMTCLAMIDEVEPALDEPFAARVAKLVENRAAAIEALPEIAAVLRSYRLRTRVLEATARHYKAQEDLSLAFARDAVAAMAAADRDDVSLRRRIKAVFRAPAARFGQFAETQSALSDKAASDLPAAAALLDLGIPDLAFYAAENADVAEADVDLYAHFLERGLAEDRRAHPDFDPAAYAEANPDVIDAGVPSFAHFLRSGALEGRPEGSGTPEQRLAAVAVRLSGMFGAQQAAGNDAAMDAVQLAAGDAPGGRGIDAVVAKAASFAQRAGRHGHRAPLLGLGATPEVDRALIAKSGLFDAAWYASNNADAGDEASALAHFLDVGRAEGRAPNAFFDPVWYAEQDEAIGGAAAAFVHYLRYGRVEGRRPSEGFDPHWYAAQLADESVDAASALAFHLASGAARGLRTSRHPPSRATAGGAVPARALIRSFGQDWAPLSVHLDHGGPPTVSMITDSVDAHSLFGGVGTAIVFGVLAAQRLGARFRLVTRTTPPLAEALGEVLRAHRVDWSGPTELVHIPVDGNASLFLGPRDTVVTTSWWTTASALGAVPASQIVYLLQEDERMFYPFGDVRLRCEEVLSRPDLRVVVNSQLLAEHFRGPAGVAGLMNRAVWFDPAFPAAPAAPDPFRDGGKSNFFFYARPNHGRNVYWRGLEAIEAAVCEGVLDPAAWNFTFAGSNLPRMTIGGVEPRVVPKVSWMDYTAMTARIDLGLCLMDTPHPSYPPIDLAAAGAVVVTNTHRNKTSLDAWSANIVCSDISVRNLVVSIRRAAALALDAPAREANYRRQRIPRDWGRQFEPAFDALFSGV